MSSLFRKKPKLYGYEVKDFALSEEGLVQYAQWLHPTEGKHGVHQEDVDALRTFLNPGDVVLDIGGNTGNTALHEALAVGPTGCVLAFEPNSHVYPVLKKNSELNTDKTKILTFPFAATAEDGRFVYESDSYFNNGGLAQGHHAWWNRHLRKQEVEGRNIYKFLCDSQAALLPRVRFVKIDTEGYDLVILKSLRPLLEEVRPFVRSEVFFASSTEERHELFEYLSSLNYQVYRFREKFSFEEELSRPEDLTQWKHFDIFCRPRS